MCESDLAELNAKIVRCTLCPRLSHYIRQVGKEKVKRFAILPRPLSVVEEELTPSLKLRRAFVVDRYKSVVDGLYCD